MATIDLNQKLYVGVTYYRELNSYKLESKRLAIACELFAESHVAEPEAQFYSYIIDDITTIIMNQSRQITSILRDTGLTPQARKKVCQGVGGHLGEGITALTFIDQILKDYSSFAHIKVGMGKTHRCPDFVAVTSLDVLYNYYTLLCLPEENINTILPIPVEAKSRKDNASIKSIIHNEAIRQLICYWRTCCNTTVEQVVGYGIVTIFLYGKKINLNHCFLRPKSVKSQEELIDRLKQCTLDDIREIVECEDFICKVESCIEGFDNVGTERLVLF
ncbi:hypothetical protein MOTE_20810 [Moorella thermoacetica]|uniref:Uncharacterized protein n=1 Tax=Neomoorella thermoacetica TaxID=1525 RepID=A0A1J5NIW9_NEOTH|nr:hypothetical protein MOTE_20810 [Moorella thermoacetica]